MKCEDFIWYSEINDDLLAFNVDGVTLRVLDLCEG
mgnify:CR=1 FL=1